MTKKQRSIFEDVKTSKAEMVSPDTGVISTGKSGSRKAVRVWLFILLKLLILMILVGGVTRLTDSGLSIAEWRPITGAIPPMSEANWLAEFQKYQAIPEYQLQNSGMSLEEFKSIYWWEWGHRQLGRLIGLVWAVGFVWLWVGKKIPTGWTARLLWIGVLGGLQGAIGWWMVSSGLTDGRVDVLPYRLAIHLGLAFIIMGFICWYIFLLKRDEMELFKARRHKETSLIMPINILLIALFIQILLGALVAGNDAGRGYTDWPLMAGEFLPSESFNEIPLWRNFFENPALVQFNHRMMGYLVGVLALFAWLKSRKSGNVKVKSTYKVMFFVVLFQIAVGIVTVMHGSVWYIALVHQFVAIMLFAMVLMARFVTYYPPEQSIKRI